MHGPYSPKKKRREGEREGGKEGVKEKRKKVSYSVKNK